jgi:formate hydrogenlyase subunit 4
MSTVFAVILPPLFQLLLVLTFAPLVTGIIRKMKARFQRRRGASILQPYYDLAKLMGKEVVVSPVASWLFHCTPYLVFTSTLVIALLVPTVVTPVPLHWIGDIITVIYLFALGRFFTALVGLDTGSAFGGLGSSREMSIASINLSIIVDRLSSTPAAMLNPAHLLAFAGLFIVTLAETGRIPVDNPATHLELTMIHEAMILEYSGRYLAFIEWASEMKLLLFLALMSNMFFPVGMATTWSPWALAIGSVAFLIKVTGLAMIVAVVESTNAKLRLFRVPELLMVAFILSLLSLILYFIVGA